MAMAEEGVPEQVAHLVSDPLQGNTDGTAHLSKVAAQLLANIASEKYAVALCGPGGSVILRRLLAASVREGGDAEVGEQVMELGWLIGHLVYVRGLLPELFGALAEVQSEDNKVGATLDPLQCVLLELLSEEMENGSTRQQLKVSAEGAPEKALRSLVFLITTIRELGYAVAKTGEEAPLEASVLEAAFQVLKDLFALDDGGASKASGRNLGSAMCQQGLVPLLLSFLVALGPIRGRAPRPAGPEAGQASSTQERPMDSSITSTAARFPRLPPYLGFRTDIVAVLAHAAYGRREVQDEILRLGGVHIMLGQCQVDDASPMVREWALWGFDICF
ncbi:hypothetical protein WJX75_005174 [Coccomyxa subellipsoidea]|uniref:Ataxin-10 domain-containing protein n=1 Tax=Coccomyxa subellipsoidea TaxID=248742 RepID=A0ABR2YRC8_9CHLO